MLCFYTNSFKVPGEDTRRYISIYLIKEEEVMNKFKGTNRLMAKIFGVLLLTAMSVSSVYAAPFYIDGAIQFGGTATAGSGETLATATSLDFDNELVTNATGSYAADGIVNGTSATFATLSLPLALGPISITPLWTVVGTVGPHTWTFDLLTIDFFAQGTGALGEYVLIAGTGVGHSSDTDFLSTSGEWTLSADSLGAAISFSSTSVVPEPATIALLGIGLLGLSSIRRRRKV